MRFISIAALLFTVLLSGCMGDSDSAPKRQGYFRIALPERKYTSYTGDCPFTFEYPTYAEIQRDSVPKQTCWINLVFPRFRCNVYMSYLTIDTNLDAYLEECRKFVVKHEVKASSISERSVENPKDRIYGIIYDIEGNAASNMQFFLTDSTRDFIRGALYFYAVPNKDSLEPVVKFVKEDIRHLVESFRWKVRMADTIKLRGGNYPPMINSHVQ